jgi:hypothetical protein
MPTESRLLVGDLDAERTVLTETCRVVHLPEAGETCSHVKHGHPDGYREVKAKALYPDDPICVDCATYELADDTREVIA